MTGTIKMVEELLVKIDEKFRLNICTLDDLNTIKATLSVLQKIASGDDWFDYKDCPKDGTLFFIEYISQGVAVAKYLSEDRALMVKSDTIMHSPPHWKHIDGAKHIAMMMEREMNDE